MRKTCEEVIDDILAARIEELDALLTLQERGEFSRIDEYALGFDYVAPDTFDDQREGYFRYQIMWGGPSDEFRFFVNPDLSWHRIEYWFMDWFDGAHRVCTDDPTARRLWQWLEDTGAVAAAMKAARH